LGLACLNVSGLVLARGSAVTVKLAQGWPSELRAATGEAASCREPADRLRWGLLGIAVAPVAVRTLIAFLPPGTAPTALHVGVDSRLLLFAFLASIAAGLLSGLAPPGRQGGARLCRRCASEAVRHSVVYDCEKLL